MRCSPNCLFGGNDDLAASWIDLGRIKRARGEYAAAEELFGRALLGYESRGRGEQASGRMSIALALAELGRTHAAAEDFSTALDYHRRSLAIRQELFPLASFPLGHPRLANAWRDLGLTHLDAGEPDEAFRALAQSVAMEHAIGESFFGSGSEAQVLNFAAPGSSRWGPCCGPGNRRACPRKKFTRLSGGGTDWSPGLSPTVTGKCAH